MPSALPDHPWHTLGAVCAWLILAFICYTQPGKLRAEEQQPLLHIHGSNTLGARLLPALLSGLYSQQGFSDIRIEPAGPANEQRVLGKDPQGRVQYSLVAAHGSSTGFSALLQGQAELAASSRPIKPEERQQLRHLGDLQSAAAEHTIAIDGLAIIVHPDNPLSALDLQQLAGLFSGQIRDWAELGGRPGPVRLYARDAQSGTFETFKELVLAAHGRPLDEQARRFESSSQLSDAVSSDPAGIGFIGLPYVRQSKALAIADGHSQPMLPSPALIATEDYPLSRRLYLYSPIPAASPWAQALLDFAQSPAGQAIVESSGFIAQDLQALEVTPSADMPEAYRTLASQALRLSVNFRFQHGSAELDNKARHDIRRLVDYLRQHDKLHDKISLIGFGDPKSRPQRATLLSKLRALRVHSELTRAGVLVRDIKGFGEQLPVAANQGNGRLKNQRVEVWLH